MQPENQTRNPNSTCKGILAKALALAAILSMGACATQQAYDEYGNEVRSTFNARALADAYLTFQQMQRNDTYYTPGAQPIERQPSSQDCARNPNGVCWR